MTESSISRSVLSWLRHRPHSWTRKLHGSGYGVVGTPDVLHIEGGRVYLIELKRLGGKMTKPQERELRLAASAGAITGVAYSLADVKAILSSSAPSRRVR